MAKRKQLSKKTRFEVFKRDSFTCQYCGRSAPDVILNVDHIESVRDGGTNDLINLITSCVSCNGGKGARGLGDDSVVAKQRAQLDELNDRRVQLEMMVEWRNSLVQNAQNELDVAVDAFDDILVGLHLNDNGKKKLSKYLKKYGFQFLIVAIDESEKYLKVSGDGDTTPESFEFAFEKIGGILYNLKMAVGSLKKYGWTIDEPHAPSADDPGVFAKPSDGDDIQTTNDNSTSWIEMVTGRAN